MCPQVSLISGKTLPAMQRQVAAGILQPVDARLGVQALWMQAKEAPKQAALRALARHNLPQDEVFADCVVQLLHAKQTNMGMAVLGPAGCGKSTCTMIARVRCLACVRCRCGTAGGQAASTHV